MEQFRRRYTWDMGNRLLVARDEISGRVARYDYDEFDNLISAEYERGGEVERLYRVPDRMGNLFESCEKDDRKYDASGRLAEDREHFYHYDCEGNLVFKEFKEMALRGGIIAPINKERLETELGIRFRAYGTGWRYDWQSDGMLARVVRPDGKEVSFAYDALGRRIRKSFAGTTTQFVWDGNVPLHEWTEESEMVTWLFEQDTFVPAAKLVANGECFFIVSDYLGTPMQAYDKQGDKVWEQELDIYGRQRKQPSAFLPFKYQGQYEDAETGLYYNRFRYYDPNAGSYISQDPIGLEGDTLNLYNYVVDNNDGNDPLSEEYENVSTFVYCHGNPICLFDPDGQGDYYTNGGVWLGSDQKKDNFVYTASGVHQSKDKNGSMVNVFENPQKLSISHSKFISQSSTVYGESSAYRVRDKKSEPSEDLKKEMYAIASVHQRNSKAYGISSEPAKDFRSKSAKERNDLPLMRTAIAAEINALKNGIDYSYGATMWDGAEQAQFSENEQRKSNGHFEIHMNTMGWNISPKHYAQWKNNIGKSFKAPMIRAARDSFYNSETKKSIPNPNAGKMRLQSTAVYGRTILWKTN